MHPSLHKFLEKSIWKLFKTFNVLTSLLAVDFLMTMAGENSLAICGREFFRRRNEENLAEQAGQLESLEAQKLTE